MRPANLQPAAIHTGSPTQPALIRLAGVSKDYLTPAGPFRALAEVSFAVFPGEFAAVIGKSGAGKTTLLNMITGVDRVTSGEVQVGGVNIHRLNETQLSRWRGNNLGVVYQAFHLLPGLSLLDNVLLPMDFCGRLRGRQSRERGLDLLRQVGLEDHARKLPSEISGGQQQRVAIARALANDPPLIIADEPTGRLDSLTAEAVFSVFVDLARRGKTILMVTHDHSLAGRVSRVFTIRDGRVSGDGNE